ncbi:MAG: hypothetical protein HY646_00360, partial [Acidobacteria bacterium]|nr:hypothetical protein [Acidobacteriota bacterium]
MTKSGLSFAAPLLRPSWSKRFAPRFIALVLLSVFAACGVLLALSGVTGIVAYSLSLRIREIGIR